jgi:formylmethanofuran dehydrogenase subunit E
MPSTHTDTSARAKFWACAWRWSAFRSSVSKNPYGSDRKRLVTFVEIDRCATDAVVVVTGCRLGKRALKFRDWGQSRGVCTGKAIRIAAKESSRALGRRMLTELGNKSEQQMLAYREMPHDDLFTTQWVKVDLRKSFPDTKANELCASSAAKGSTSAAK